METVQPQSQGRRRRITVNLRAPEADKNRSKKERNPTAPLADKTCKTKKEDLQRNRTDGGGKPRRRPEIGKTTGVLVRRQSDVCRERELFSESADQFCRVLLRKMIIRFT
ncbi:Uncharacterized protein Rs2_46679 [Raphanus sativus]|nr:Uncharacterized protein Rs2_46679 [Raphanus sativus]